MAKYLVLFDAANDPINAVNTSLQDLRDQLTEATGGQSVAETKFRETAAAAGAAGLQLELMVDEFNNLNAAIAAQGEMDEQINMFRDALEEAATPLEQYLISIEEMNATADLANATDRDQHARFAIASSLTPVPHVSFYR